MNTHDYERVEQLEKQLAVVTEERDAAVADIKHTDNCDVCVSSLSHGDCESNNFDCEKCKADCRCKTCRNENNWEWRGPQKEATHA